MPERSLLEKIQARVFSDISLIRSRSNKLLRKLYEGQHQLTSTTAFDRYPELFQEVRNNFRNKSGIKILSFGCSTGEECFSLANYFQDAFILGVDINRSNLRKAIKANSFKNVRFQESTDESIEASGKYDMIFCLSVLCRWEDTKGLTNCKDIYPFDKYEKTVCALAQQLKDHGLLVIYNSNFRFEDTKCFANFEIVSSPTVMNSGFVDKFDRYNNALKEQHTHCIYRKLSS